MKIALHIPCMGAFGGAERRLLRAYGRLAERRHVELFVREGSPGAFIEAAGAAHIDTRHFERVSISRSPFRATLDALDLLRSFASGCNVHVVFDYSRYNSILFGSLRAFHRGSAVCSLVDGTYAPSGYTAIGIAPPVPTEVLRRYLRCCDLVDLLYPQQREYYEGLVGGIVPIRLTPGTFTDLDRCVPLPKEKVISFVSARLDKAKNPDLFIDAIASCVGTLRKCGYKAEICGMGPDLGRLREKATAMRVDDVVCFPGYVDTAAQLGSSQLVCLCGASGQYPSQVLAEGAACGCFVVATRACAVEDPTERLLAPHASELVECNATAVGRAIAWYVALPDDEKIGVVDTARAFAETVFSIERTVDYFEEVCEEAARFHRRIGE